MCIRRFEYPAHLSDTNTVNVAVGHINGLNARVSLKNIKQKQEILLANIVLRQVNVLDAIGTIECYREMFYTNRMVEELIKSGVLYLLLILHLDF